MSVTAFANNLRSNPSSASLAQYYQEHNPAFSSGAQAGANGSAPHNELDFCNAFWGEGDAGYEVIMAKLRASSRTMDELKSFWKERASIEEDYAKRLAKLGKTVLGKDEIGELRNALDTLRNETDKQASARAKLSMEIRRDVETPTTEFASRMANLRKTYAANIEKSYKNKSAQEGHVAKARERYEQDCLRINACTANASIAQGKELERLQAQLRKTQATVGSNEKEYQSYVRLLDETTRKWETEWKAFCDHVQDLEEERIDFVKDNAWAYANAVSSVCVTDDESCERVRVALEGFEASTEIQTFVRAFGTGAKIPDPPLFVDYARGEAHYNDNTSRVAQFARTSSRGTGAVPGMIGSPAREVEAPREIRPITPSKPTSVYEPPAAMVASPEPPRAVPPATREPTVQDAPAARMASPALANTSAAPSVRPPSAFARPGSAFGQTPPPTGPLALKSQQTNGGDVNNDPIARSLAELRNNPPPAGSIKRTSIRRPESQATNRNSFQPPKSPGPMSPAARAQSPYGQPQHQAQVPPSAFAGRQSMQMEAAAVPPTSAFSSRQQMPSESASPVAALSPRQQQPVAQRPYSPAQPQVQAPQAQAPTHVSRKSMDASLIPPMAGFTAAELARSKAEHANRTSRAYDHGQAIPRPSSPAGSTRSARSTGGGRAPSPALMQPPQQAPSPVADQVLEQYHQAFPGERAGSRGPSRQGSISSRHSRRSMQQAPPSPGATQGFAGIGAGGGRSPSPQPYHDHRQQQDHHRLSGAPSAALVANTGQIPQNTSYPDRSTSRQSQYGASQRGPQQQQHQPSEQVSHGYANSPRSPEYGHQSSASVGRSSTYQSMQAPPPAGQAQNPYVQAQHAQSPAQAYAAKAQQYAAGVNGYGQNSYGSQSRPGAQYPQQQQQQQQPGPTQHAGYTSAQSPQQPYNPGYGSQRSAAGGYAQDSYNSYGAPRGVSPAPQQQPAVQSYAAPAANVAAPAQYTTSATTAAAASAPAAGRSPSPMPAVAPVDAPPTGQYSTTGEPVLFYVKALYDYEAASETEFNFQVGDIIAVTKTPADGWWSGELLDEARRRPGKTDFPSNL